MTMGPMTMTNLHDFEVDGAREDGNIWVQVQWLGGSGFYAHEDEVRALIGELERVLAVLED
jgi:hypothetical protein